MPYRLWIAGAVVVGSAALMAVSGHQIAQRYDRAAEAPAPASLVPGAGRTPRIASDMGPTFRNLERMAAERLEREQQPPAAAAKTPSATQQWTERAQPVATRAPAAPPVAPSTEPPGAAAAQALPAPPRIGVAPGRGQPTSLVPVARDRRAPEPARAMDSRQGAALSALALRPTRPTGPVIAASGAIEAPVRNEADMTADELNEREHRRNRQSPGADTQQP